MIIKPTIRLRLRAAAAVLALALGWLATPLSLAAYEPDVCEMECCVEAGHCCCATRHAYVAGQLPDPGEVTLNVTTELIAPCPATCAGATSSAQLHLPHGQRAALHFVAAAVLPLAREWQLGAPVRSFAARPSAPRAPPLLAV
jgi:hypothetical protein